MRKMHSLLEKLVFYLITKSTRSIFIAVLCCVTLVNRIFLTVFIALALHISHGAHALLFSICKEMKKCRFRDKILVLLLLHFHRQINNHGILQLSALSKKLAPFLKKFRSPPLKIRKHVAILRHRIMLKV